MNIHPAFVHFPIALLCIYALMELLRFSFVTRYTWWQSVKQAMLFIGVVSAYATIITGTIAKGDSTVATVLAHQKFAWITTLTFTLLAVVHVFALQGKSWAQEFIASFFTPILAFCGLVGLFVVGSLGASMVYGPNVDPIVHFFYSILFPAQ
jgi:uncharacterized membrane protein